MTYKLQTATTDIFAFSLLELQQLRYTCTAENCPLDNKYLVTYKY